MSRRVGILLGLLLIATLVVLFRGGTPTPEERAAAGRGEPTALVPRAARPAPFERGAGDAAAPRSRAQRLAPRRLEPVSGPLGDLRRQPGAGVEGEDEVTLLIRAATEDPDPHNRAAAIADLSLLDELDVVLPVIQIAANDQDPDVKLAVVSALAELGEAAPIDLLTRFADDPDPEIRLEVLSIVENLSEEDSVPGLVRPILDKATRDPDEDVRDKALDIVEVISENDDSDDEY